MLLAHLSRALAVVNSGVSHICCSTYRVLYIEAYAKGPQPFHCRQKERYKVFFPQGKRSVLLTWGKEHSFATSELLVLYQGSYCILSRGTTNGSSVRRYYLLGVGANRPWYQAMRCTQARSRSHNGTPAADR